MGLWRILRAVLIALAGLVLLVLGAVVGLRFWVGQAYGDRV